MIKPNWFAIALAGFLLAFGVIIGAFGAHALRDSLDDYSMGIYKTAHQYQMWQALGLLIMGALGSPKICLHCVWIGMILFSGSLYALAISGVSWLGAITPFGGVIWIGGWTIFALWAYKVAKTQKVQSESS